MKKQVYDMLKKLNIEFIVHEHEPLYTCEQANKYFWHIKSWKSKNLFVRNKKWDKYFLLIIEDHKKADLKQIWDSLWVWKLSIASEERLQQNLWITTWAVGPFSLLNDESWEIFVLIDNNLLESEKLFFHPNVNTETLEITKNDFIKYLVSKKINYRVM